MTQDNEQLILVLAELAAKSLLAYSAAAGVPITAESVLALLPDMAPLPAPVVAPAVAPVVAAPVALDADVPQHGPGLHMVVPA